jgi:hypothetical protein
MRQLSKVLESSDTYLISRASNLAPNTLFVLHDIRHSRLITPGKLFVWNTKMFRLNGNFEFIVSCEKLVLQFLTILVMLFGAGLCKQERRGQYD